jgi:hypothetical protein
MLTFASPWLSTPTPVANKYFSGGFIIIELNKHTTTGAAVYY